MGLKLWGVSVCQCLYSLYIVRTLTFADKGERFCQQMFSEPTDILINLSVVCQ